VKIHVRADDLGGHLDRAVELSGSRLVEPTELPDGFGTVAIFADPDGNAVGLWA
jgi:predicted enzyme related to lactoylglutathione lyase